MHWIFPEPSSAVSNYFHRSDEAVPLGFRERESKIMYGGEFDGNAAFAGGGFMPSQATTQAPESSSAFKVSYLSIFFAID